MEKTWRKWVFGGIFSSVMGMASLAWAEGEKAPQGPAGGLGMFMPMILIFVVFYFLLIRPQQKQAKERAKTLEALKNGDPVILTAGIYGKIVGINESILTIEIANNVRVKALRSAVQGLEPQAIEGKKE